SDPCYGACDLADDEMKEAGAMALFHFGHSEIPMKTSIPVHYIECRSDADPLPLIAGHLSMLPKKVGLVATVQHAYTLGAVKNYLKNEGFDAYIGPAKGRAKYPGQVLGCSFSSASSISHLVDAFMYIGSGNFHPLGVALSTGKRTLAVDVLLGEVRDITELKEGMLKQRYAKLAKALKGDSFGVVVGEKKGQMRRTLARRMKKKLEAEGRRAYLIHLVEITPENLVSFRKLDALVNTACPRIAMEDALRFKPPMLTPIELDMVLGDREWDDYEMDEFQK
ncbi:MAG: diphthamide biosynthesis enzyme Dph2, partial [Candidatus Hydrothermarchaeaceae archaeon]